MNIIKNKTIKAHRRSDDLRYPCDVLLSNALELPLDGTVQRVD